MGLTGRSRLGRQRRPKFPARFDLSALQKAATESRTAARDDSVTRRPDPDWAPGCTAPDCGGWPNEYDHCEGCPGPALPPRGPAAA